MKKIIINRLIKQIKGFNDSRVSFRSFIPGKTQGGTEKSALKGCLPSIQHQVL